MEFKEIVQTITDIGLSATISAGVVYFLFVYASNFFKAKRSKITTYNGLANYHEIFYKIRRYVDIAIPNMNMKSPVRTKMFRDMLMIKLTVIDRNLKELLLNKTLTNENMLNQNLLTLEKIVKEYQTEWKESGIPETVSIKFEEWHMSKTMLLYDSIKQICECQVIDTPVEEMYSILNIYLAVVNLTIVDAEKTLTTLNGTLSGKEYKGEVIE